MSLARPSRRRDTSRNTGMATKYASESVGSSPPSTSVAVSKSMKANKSPGTGPELLLARQLRRRLRRHNLPGHPDFAYRNERVAVFVHGCWWHRCPIENYPLPKSHRGYWRRKFARNVERDQINRQALEKMGWSVVEIWEHEVRDSPVKAANRVRDAVAMRKRHLA